MVRTSAVALRRHRHLALVVTAVVGLLAGACGDGADATTTAAVTDREPALAPADRTPPAPLPTPVTLAAQVTGLPSEATAVMSFYAPSVQSSRWCDAIADDPDDWAGFYDAVIDASADWRSSESAMFALVGFETTSFCPGAAADFIDAAQPDGHELRWIDEDAYVCRTDDIAFCWAYSGGPLADAIGDTLTYDWVCAAGQCNTADEVARAGAAVHGNS